MKPNLLIFKLLAGYGWRPGFSKFYAWDIFLVPFFSLFIFFLYISTMRLSFAARASSLLPLSSMIFVFNCLTVIAPFTIFSFGAFSFFIP